MTTGPVTAIDIAQVAKDEFGPIAGIAVFAGILVAATAWSDADTKQYGTVTAEALQEIYKNTCEQFPELVKETCKHV